MKDEKKTFITEYKVVGEKITASSWDEAKKIAKDKNITLVGELE